MISLRAGELSAPGAPPALAPNLPRPPLAVVAVDVMPWELRVGDLVPFTDHVGRPVVDIRAVGMGRRGRHLMFADLPPLTVHHALRIYRRPRFRPAVRCGTGRERC